MHLKIQNQLNTNMLRLKSLEENALCLLFESRHSISLL